MNIQKPLGTFHKFGKFKSQHLIQPFEAIVDDKDGYSKDFIDIRNEEEPIATIINKTVTKILEDEEMTNKLEKYAIDSILENSNNQHLINDDNKNIFNEEKENINNFEKDFKDSVKGNFYDKFYSILQILLEKVINFFSFGKKEDIVNKKENEDINEEEKLAILQRRIFEG